MLACTRATRSMVAALSKVPARLSSSPSYARQSKNINATYVPSATSLPEAGTDEVGGAYKNVPSNHWEEEWSTEDLRAAAANHVASTWGPSKVAKDLPIISHGSGVYLYDANGTEYLDWTSQAVCSNLGHTVPEAIKDAVVNQMERIPMVYGGLGLTEARIRLAKLMSDVSPGDLNSFIFPSGGGEANEAAIRIARRYTGKHKILNQYRSYHGGSTTSLSATGDFRRWFAESGATGFVKMFNAQPFGFEWGHSEESKTELLLNMLCEQIEMEGPSTIAAIMLEPIVGAGGTLIPPKGYIEGVRALCDKYDILLIADEVMVGFGRTGKFWGFEHFRGVIPDIVTSAKGLSASVLPLAMVGMRQHIRDFFEDTPLGWGATYANHPVALACAYESVKYLIEKDLPSRAAQLEEVMVEEMQSIVEKHGSVRQGRAIGLFGCFDLVDEKGTSIQKYQDPMPPKVQHLKRAMLEEGLIGLFRPPLLHCAPPLVIEEGELRDGFRRLDRALCVLD